ncbi:hypothetical protein PINS_up014646 [Pythium insidiosum]|nr:hypothetical protein PINS_up014646 [Pythium insidiosum]
MAKDASESWTRWFVLPYVRHPERDPFFRPFFAKDWVESLVTSFRNFLSLVFRSLPLPKLLALQISRLEEPSLDLRLKASLADCNRLRIRETEANERIRTLENSGRLFYDVLRTLVEHTFHEHFALGDAVTMPSWNVNAPMPPDAMHTVELLAEQLKKVESYFSASASPTHGSNLDDPISVKLPATWTKPTARQPSQSPPRSGESSGSVEDARSGLSMNPQLHCVEDFEVPLDTGGEALCAFAPDGNHLAVSNTNSNEIAVFQETGASQQHQLVSTIKTEATVAGLDWVSSMTLVYALQDGSLCLWDSMSCSRVFMTPSCFTDKRPSLLCCAPSAHVGALVLSNTPLAAASCQSSIQFFSVENDTIHFILDALELDEAISSIGWAPDNTLLGVASSGGKISIWNATQSKPSRMCSFNLSSDARVEICFSTDGTSIFTTDTASAQVKEWKIGSSGQRGESHEQAITVAHCVHSVVVQDVSQGDTERDLHIAVANNQLLVGVKLSSPNRTQGLLAAFSFGDADSSLPQENIEDGVEAIHWNSNAKRLAVVTTAGRLQLWSLEEPTAD